MRAKIRQTVEGGGGRPAASPGPQLSFPSLYQDPHRVPKNTLSVTDNRTGKQYELPIESGTIRAVDLRQIKLGDGDQGLETYDPGFLNTAACRSAISFIDGDKGILRYRAYPDNDLSYTGNFLNMMFKTTEVKYTPNKTLERALDVLLILHADHEQNCSTSAMRGVGSSHADPYSAMAAAAAALYGPLHGGANEEVLKTLREIGSKDRIPAYIDRVKRGEFRLFGFGHRIYKNYDPRATIIKRIAEEVFDVTGKNPLIDIAVELERIALQDDYFVSRKLYPNVDFYSGIIYEAMKFPIDMFPVLFAIGRTPGWLAQWQEMLLDKDQKIARPRQIYTGPEKRDYVPIEHRG